MCGSVLDSISLLPCLLLANTVITPAPVIPLPLGGYFATSVVTEPMASCMEEESVQDTDADWSAGEERKSIGGYVCLINRRATPWASKKQTSVASPSTEPEYMAWTQDVKESL